MNYNSLFDKELVTLNMEVTTKEEAIQTLSRLLKSKGYVRGTYTKAVLDREEVFPTGLIATDIGVAIPHSDKAHVIIPKVAIGILKEPVKFNCMGDPKSVVDVRLIFLLALTDSNLQISTLKNIVTVIQNKSLLSKVVHCRNQEKVVTLIESNFNMTD